MDNDDTRDFASIDTSVGHGRAYLASRNARLVELDTAYVVWCKAGEQEFPADFDSWRAQNHDLIATHSPIGLPLVAAGENTPESEKAALLFERS